MGIDAETIQIFVWKIVKFSMNSCYRFVQKHPFVSGVVLLFFLLYLFLPYVFFFLIYSSPVMVAIYVFMRYHLKLKRPETKSDNKRAEESKSLAADDAAVVVSRNDNKPVINDSQVSRRKNVNKEFEAEGGSNEETGISLATTPVDASIVNSLNVITEEKGSASLDHGESSTSQNVSRADDIQELEQPGKVLESHPSMDDLVIQKELGDQTEKSNAAAAAAGAGAGSGSGSGGEKEEESSDEEETMQNRNNAVEWTADDQQNLMDLGDSELERNKRLESLIARRRARKSFKMALEKRVMESGNIGGQMPPISIVRNNILNIPDNQDYEEGPHIPGSAPSVLLPARNPFDIPYDPFEERPNLTGDSFHEEFAINQRDLLFCRHESFFLGPSFSFESQHDQHNSHFSEYGIEKRTAPGLRLSRYRTVSDMSAHDQLIDDLLASQEGESMSRNLSATDLVELGSQSPKESKISEESKRGRVAMEGEAIENSADRSEFQMDTDSTRDDSSELCPLASDEAIELSFQANTSSSIGNLVPKPNKHRRHLSDRLKSSRTFTIPEEIALNGYSYDTGPPTFDKPRLDDHLFFKDRLHCHSPGLSIASDLQVEVSEIGSPPLPIDETMSPADAEYSFDGDIDKDDTSGSEEMWRASCNLAGVDENESRSREVIEVSMDDILAAGISTMKQNLQNQIASSSLPAQVAEQDKSNTSLLSSSRTGMQEENRTHSKHPNNKVSENVQQVLEELPKSPCYSHSLPPQIPKKASSAMRESVSHQPTEVSSEKPEELSNPPVEKSAEVNATPEFGDQEVHGSNDKDNLKSTEEMGGGSEMSTNKEAIMHLSQPEIEPEREPPKLNEPEVGSSSTTTEVQDDQNTTEAGVSGVNQSFDNRIMSPPLSQILEGDQISTISSSCSSPRSVLPGKNRTLSSASFDQRIPIQNDEPQSNLDDIVRNSSLGDMSIESVAGNYSLDGMSTESVAGNNSLDGMSAESVVRNNLLDDMSTESVILVSAPESSQHLVADPVDLISSSSGFRISEERSTEVVEATSEPVINLQADVLLSESVSDNPSKSEKNAEGTPEPVINLQVDVVQSESVDDSPSKPENNVEGTSEPVINLQADVLLSESINCSPSKPETNVEGTSEPAINLQADVVMSESIDDSPSKSEKNAADSNGSGNMMKEEETSNSPAQRTIEADLTNSINHSAEDQKENKGKSVVGGEGESKNVMEDEAATEPSVPTAETSVEKEPSDPLSQKPIPEAGVLHNVNEAVADDTSNTK